MIQSASDVFEQSKAAETTAFYCELIQRGPVGEVAFGLFRAQKRSARAKQYRSNAHRRKAYNAKAEALKYLCAALGQLNLKWGWGQDPSQPVHNQVLYVDLPRGQVSYHSDRRHSEIKYEGKWDGQHASKERVLSFCDAIMQTNPLGLCETTLMPFGRFAGTPLGDLGADYVEAMRDWDGLDNWPAFKTYWGNQHQERKL